MKILNFFLELSDWRSFSGSQLQTLITKFFHIFFKMIYSFFSRILRNLNSNTNHFDIFISITMVMIYYFPTVQIFKWFWEFDGGWFFFPANAWLTSYEGGFVRRGLSGTILKYIVEVTNVIPHHIIIVITSTSFIVLLLWTIKICGNKIPLYVLFSAVLFSLSARHDIIVAKDYVLILLYFCSLKILLSNSKMYIKFITVNTICVFAILNHILFTFLLLPLLILIFNFNEYNKFFSFKCIYFFIFPILSMLAIFIHTPIPIESTEKIADYWREYYPKLPNVFGGLHQSWHEVHFVRVQDYWTTLHRGFLWLPLVWVILWYLCGLFLAKFINHYDEGRERRFLVFYYFSSLCSLPMYFLAFDYGRWVSMVSIASFLAAYSTKPSFLLPKLTERAKIRSWTGSFRLWQRILIVTCFAIPSQFFHPGSYYYTMPIWYPVHKIIDMDELKEDIGRLIGIQP